MKKKNTFMLWKLKSRHVSKRILFQLFADLNEFEETFSDRGFSYIKFYDNLFPYRYAIFL